MDQIKHSLDENTFSSSSFIISVETLNTCDLNADPTERVLQFNVEVKDIVEEKNAWSVCYTDENVHRHMHFALM